MYDHFKAYPEYLERSKLPYVPPKKRVVTFEAYDDTDPFNPPITGWTFLKGLYGLLMFCFVGVMCFFTLASCVAVTL